MPLKIRFVLLLISSFLALAGICRADDQTEVASQRPPRPEADAASPVSDELGRWAFEVGVAVIGEKRITELFQRKGTFAEGDAGGRIYLFTLYYTFHVFPVWVGDNKHFPQLETHLTLGVVDERARSPFLDYNAAVAIRWNDFPWNRILYTTFATGVGLSYSEKVFAMDRRRHPGQERSHLKFDWPLQITLAHPRHRSHQFVLFNQHQSGGHIFDRGGVNSLGVGYKYIFPD